MSQRPNDKREVCQRCSFYFDYGESGECRKRAPVQGVGISYGAFPKMGHDAWCGDFNLRDHKEEQP